MRQPIYIATALLILSACGAPTDSKDNGAAGPTSDSSPSAPRASVDTRPPSPRPSPTPSVLSPADARARLDERLVSTFPPEGLLDALKSEPLVEAVEVLKFDPSSRTVLLNVASVFRASEDARNDLAFSLTRDISSAVWAPRILQSVGGSVEALPAWALDVDGLAYNCDAATMVAIADREVGLASFVEKCRS